jgi:hypothetical protein
MWPSSTLKLRSSCLCLCWDYGVHFRIWLNIFSFLLLLFSVLVIKSFCRASPMLGKCSATECFLFLFYFIFFFYCFIIHMCIQCLGYFSPLLSAFYVIPLCLSFLICKLKIIIVFTSISFCEEKCNETGTLLKIILCT